VCPFPDTDDADYDAGDVADDDADDAWIWDEPASESARSSSTDAN